MSSRTVIRLAAYALLWWVVPATASGQPGQVFGTFPWQLLPYCNVVTLTLTNTPAGLTLDGADDQCGATNKASAVGMATFNGAGNVTLSFTVVTAPSGKPVHVSAVVSPANGNGTWTDSVGNAGTFAFFSAVPGLPGRPLPASGIAPASVTGAEIDAGAVGAAEIAAGAVRAGHLGVIRERVLTQSLPPGATGIAGAACSAGERAISGGYNASSFDVIVRASLRQSGDSWLVISRNNGASSASISVRVNCLAE